MRRSTLVLTTLALLAGTAFADGPDITNAKKLNDGATAKMTQKNYEGAAADFRAANDIASAPGVIYNAAQAYRLASQQGREENNLDKMAKNRDLAREWYQKYLDAKAGDDDKEIIAQGWLKKLNDQWAEEHPKEEAARQKAADDAQAAKTREEREKLDAVEKRNREEKEHIAQARREEQAGKARTVKIVGLSVMGGGVIATGVGIVFGLKAKKLSDELTDINTYDTGKIDDGHNADRNMKIAYITGGALLVGGAVTYMFGRVIGARTEESSTTVSIVPGADGGGTFVLGGHF